MVKEAPSNLESSSDLSLLFFLNSLTNCPIFYGRWLKVDRKPENFEFKRNLSCNFQLSSIPLTSLTTHRISKVIKMYLLVLNGYLKKFKLVMIEMRCKCQ